MRSGGWQRLNAEYAKQLGSRPPAGRPTPRSVIDLASALIAHLSVGDGPEAWGWAAGTGILWGLSYVSWRRLQVAPGEHLTAHGRLLKP
jgi:hypothetical protein